jgi:hypothetical protein
MSFRTQPTIAPLHVLTSGFYGTLTDVLYTSYNPAFAAFNWVTANLARYSPIVMPVRFTLARFMSPNNNTTGNVDMGIYNDGGKLLASTGSTARTGAPAVQYIAPSVGALSLPPGSYWLAMVCSSTTSQVMRTAVNAAFMSKIAGALQETLGATALPATMTPVATALTTDMPVWGFTQSATL